MPGGHEGLGVPGREAEGGAGPWISLVGAGEDDPARQRGEEHGNRCGAQQEDAHLAAFLKIHAMTAPPRGGCARHRCAFKRELANRHEF